MVVVNTTMRGGSGGYLGWSVYNNDHIDSLEISLHEVGHTFGGLTDEYVSYSNNFTGSESDLTMWNNTLPLPNATTVSGGKWAYWNGYNDPHPNVGPIGWFLGGHYHPNLFRPTFNSKMLYSYGAGNYLRVPFNAVGREAIVRQIYRVVTPLDSHNPPAGALTNPGTLSVTPIDPAVIQTTWDVNGQDGGVGTTFNTQNLQPGTYTITACSFDSWYPFDPNDPNHDLDGWRDPDRDSLKQTVTWTVTIMDSQQPCDLPPPTGQEQYLQTSDPNVMKFGERIDKDGDTLVVGPGNNLGTGTSVQVFERTGGSWVETALLQGSQSDQGDRFGGSVAVSGNTIAVGDLDNFIVYIYEKDVSGNWLEKQIIEREPNIGLSTLSIALNSDRLFVRGITHPPEDYWGFYQSIHVYAPGPDGTWSRTTSFTGSNIEGNTQGFGNSIDAYGSTVVVGAPIEASASSGIGGNQNSTTSPRSGAAYVFRESQGEWIQEAYIKANVNMGGAEFGTSVAIYDNRIIVGAPNQDVQPLGLPNRRVAGNAFVYDRTVSSWSLAGSLAQYNIDYDRFGTSVAISSRGILVGAYGDDSRVARDCGYMASVQNQSGAGYYYEQNPAGHFDLVNYFKTINPVANHDPSGIWLGRSAALDGNHAYLGASNEGPGAVYVFPLEANQAMSQRFDWNGDGWSDLFFQGNDGRLAVWNYESAQYLGGQLLSHNQTIFGTKAVGHTDINGDGHQDIIWQSANGQISIWLMNQTTRLQEIMSHNPSAPWRIIGIDDLNKDGLDDWIYRHQTAGDCAVWYMNGSSYLGNSRLPTTSSPGWRIAAVRDLNSDGNPDLIWQSTTVGTLAVWYLDGTSFRNGELLPSPPAGWELKSVHDLDRDGHPDFVFQNQTSAKIAAWFMEGNQRKGFTYPRSPSPGWTIRHSGE